jgi:pyroglutamyl-peptidase
MTSVLAMGFGPFGQVTENPTESMVRKLGLEHSDLECRVLQTSYRYVQTELPSLLLQFKPDAVVVFGYAASADSIRLESVAKNRNDTSLQDIEGRFAEPLVLPDAPEQYRSTLPIPDIEQALALHGMESIRSSEAGGFVCNFAFFLLMHLAEAQGVKITGLVHVPNQKRYQERHRRELDLDMCAEVVISSVEEAVGLERPNSPLTQS